MLILKIRGGQTYTRSTLPQQESLRRLVGPVTTFLISLGVAIGSGIFVAPGLVAKQFDAPIAMLLIWVIGGLFSLVSGLVSAELATRFPRAGGEYVYVREAFGEFAAFFFGWGYSVLIIGCGAATIAAATGRASAELVGLDVEVWGPTIGAGAVLAITLLNAIGLKAGASLQNVLTGAKILALLFVAVVAIGPGHADTHWLAPIRVASQESLGSAFVAAVVPVMFAYAGTTDAAKMAEEIQDVRRDLPRALIGSAFALTALYMAVNVAYMVVLTPAEMAGTHSFVASDLMQRIFGDTGRRVMAFLNLVVFLGALSATILATVRVTFALARDGLTFAFMAKMSRGQAPVPALLVVGGIATLLTYSRTYEQILNIYYLASSVLFGMAYASLIVFRVRERRIQAPPPNAFRCPLGEWLALLLILFQLYLAAGILESSKRDSLYTAALLAFFGVLYVIWKRAFHPARTSL